MSNFSFWIPRSKREIIICLCKLFPNEKKAWFKARGYDQLLAIYIRKRNEKENP